MSRPYPQFLVIYALEGPGPIETRSSVVKSPPDSTGPYPTPGTHQIIAEVPERGQAVRMAGSTHRADRTCPRRQEVDRKMTTASSGGAVLLHYVAVSTSTGELYYESSFFFSKFPPDAELATMQDGNLQRTRLLMA